MLIRKLLAGVGVMTGIYVAAALQAGPDQADANVCKLLRRFHAGVPEQCVSSSLDNWGTAFAVVFVLLCIFVLLYDFRERVPVYRVCGVTLRRTIPHAKYAWSMVEPWHVIIFGLLTASLGVAWQLYSGTPTTLTQTEIKNLRSQLKTSEQNNSSLEALLMARGSAEGLLSLAQEYKEARTPKPHLSSIDYNERRQILNALYKQVNGPIRDTYALAWGFYNDQPRLINTNQKGVFEGLVKIREQLLSEWQKQIEPLMREAEVYPDIRQLNWNFHTTTILESLNELINKLRVPVEGGQTVFVDSKETDKLKAGIDALGHWIDTTKEEVQRLRSQDDTTEKTKPTPAQQWNIATSRRSLISLSGCTAWAVRKIGHRLPTTSLPSWQKPTRSLTASASCARVTPRTGFKEKP